MEQSIAGTNRLGGPAGDDIHPKKDNGDKKDKDKYKIKVGLVTVDLGEIIEKTFEFTVSMLMSLITSAINVFNSYILGVPAPGNPTKVSTWTSPGNPWPAVYSVYGIMTAIALALLTPSAMVAMDIVDPHQRRERLTELGKAAFFILFGIPVIAFGLHLGNEITQAIAPSGYEFIASTNGLADLSLGLLFGAFLIWAKGSVVGVGILASLIIYMSVYILVAFWPLFWALRVQPQADLQSFGTLGLSMFPLIILLRFTQGGILRLLHQLPYNSLGGIAIKIIAIIAGLFIALLGLPYVFLTKLFPRTMIQPPRGSSSSGGGSSGPPGGGSGSPVGKKPNWSSGSNGSKKPGVTSKSPDGGSSSRSSRRSYRFNRRSSKSNRQSSSESDGRNNVIGIPGQSPKGDSSKKSSSKRSIPQGQESRKAASSKRSWGDSGRNAEERERRRREKKKKENEEQQLGASSKSPTR